ncbi:MAG: YfhO family protein, partial [Actinomycetota bacterium]
PYDAPGGIDRWVTDDIDLRGLAIINGTSSILGYDPLIQKSWALMTNQVYYGTFGDGRIWGSGWFADVLRIDTAYLAADAVTDPSWTDRGALPDSRLHRYIRPPRLPEAYVVGSVAVTDLADIATRLQDDAQDFRHTAFLDHGNATFARVVNPNVNASVEGSMATDGTGAFTVKSDGPGVLVISSAWLNGWQATVNGKSVPVERADGLVLAVPIDKGLNEVHLEFQSPGLRTGALIALASVLSLVALAVAERLRRRAVAVVGSDPEPA